MNHMKRRQILLKQLQIASEWDRIENTLQDDSFWYFIYNKNNKKGKKLKQFGPIDMFESFRTNTVKNLQDNIDQLNNRILELESDANNWKKFKNKPIKTILLKTKNKIKTKIK